MRGQERPLVKVQPPLQGDSTMEGSQGTTEAWHHEKLGEAIDEGKAPAAMETPGMKISWRRAETWHHVTGSEPLKRGQGTLGKDAASGDSSIL